MAATTLANLASAQTPVDYSPGTGIELIPGYNVQMRVDEDGSKAIFEVYMKDSSWLGLVLGKANMTPGSDMIQIMADGVNSRVYDKFSQGFISPAEDSNDNLDATFRFFDGDYIRFTIERDLDTGDGEHDFVLPIEQDFQLGWAIHSSSNNLLAKHSHAGGLTAMLYQGGLDSFEESNKSGAFSAVFASNFIMTIGALIALTGVF